MKIIAFGASTNKNSINKILAEYSIKLLREENNNIETEILDLNDFTLPIYSEDLEKESGIPDMAKSFFNKIGSADALIISFAEHNGNYTASFKNLFDWCTRINPKFYQGKKTIALSTSPGKLGGASVIEIVKSSAKFFDCNIVDSLSIGSFYEVFDQNIMELSNSDLKLKLLNTLKKIL
jgi:chromate reductase, NAD(P)H dehydrogenase (quinone)